MEGFSLSLKRASDRPTRCAACTDIMYSRSLGQSSHRDLGGGDPLPEQYNLAMEFQEPKLRLPVETVRVTPACRVIPEHTSRSLKAPLYPDNP